MALAVTRAGNLFTTHTPVEAGFDRFSIDLMRLHFEQYCGDRLKISFHELMALGRRECECCPRTVQHGLLRSARMWRGEWRQPPAWSRQPLAFSTSFPRWPTPEVPVRHVTNGVHVPTWDSNDAHELWANVCGKDCWHGGLNQTGSRIVDLADARIWICGPRQDSV